MPIEMPKGLPFSVDTWNILSSKRKRHHFLSHAHKDHSLGISSHSSFPIYCSNTTMNLLLLQFPKLDPSLFLLIEVGETLVINDPDGAFNVTAFDANHCPGAIMFLFEGNFGNLLHTGDCRLSPECLQNLPEKYLGKKGKEPKCCLDYVFLDCTFGKSPMKIPSKYAATRQVISCIWKHPNATVVYLACDLLGQEEILVEISQTFGSKIFVNKIKNPECFENLTLIAPDILNEDASSRFHLFNGFPKLYERASEKLAEARAHSQPEPLFIRPSAQWYACEESSDIDLQIRHRFAGAVQDPYGVWHVCYSMHSSREELEWALQLLQPKRVISTTLNCRAMELDYMKKHCFKSQIASDDPLWKLLDIDSEVVFTSPEASTLHLEVVGKVAVCSPQVKESDVATEAKQLQSKNLTTSCIKSRLNIHSPSKKSPITLFGRARVDLHDSNFLYIENKALPPEVRNETSVSYDILHSEETAETQSAKQDDEGIVEEAVVKTLEGKIEVLKSTSHSCIGSPKKSVNDCIKKLYRSMNVPVPRPLPSLVELMNDTRAKRRRLMH